MGTHWIDANGVQLRYELSGGPGGVVVLAHEMGGALESWDEVAPLLAGRATVLRYDQRGAGLSEKINGILTIETAAGDLAALLDALSISAPVAVVGAAVGGAVAAAFAARYPERTAALVLLAPATGLAAERQPAALERIEAIERLGVRAAFADGGEGPRGRYETIRLASDPASLAATWRMLAALDMDPMLAAISCPTLVAAGRRDTARPPDHIAAVAARIPRSRFVELDTGHVMAIDTPQLVATTIMDFLEVCDF